MTTRICIGCGEAKPVDAFPTYVSNARRTRRSPIKRCRECHSRYQADYSRLRKYGLTPEAYAAMLRGQDGKCAACGDETTLVVDHCHDTGKIRGLLCGSCNKALGHAKEDPVRLRAVADYIERA